MKRFAVYPGWVTSPNDGDRHYISENMLMRLYRVDPRECVVVRDEYDKRGLRDVLPRLLELRPFNNHYIPVSELERRQYPIRDRPVIEGPPQL